MKAPAIFLFAVGVIFGASPANALPPTARQATGRIISVERDAQRFTFRRADNGERLTLTWNRDTRFYRDTAKESSAILKQGECARVSYRLPWFGPDHARRVVRLGGTCEGLAK